MRNKTVEKMQPATNQGEKLKKSLCAIDSLRRDDETMNDERKKKLKIFRRTIFSHCKEVYYSLQSIFPTFFTFRNPKVMSLL